MRELSPASAADLLNWAKEGAYYGYGWYSHNNLNSFFSAFIFITVACMMVFVFWGGIYFSYSNLFFITLFTLGVNEQINQQIWR